MVQISTNQFKKGMSLIVDGNLVDIVEFQFVKPGKGGAFVRTKLKNMKTGAVLEKTFDSKERVEQAHIDKRQWEYLYRDGDAYVFMDNETYDQTNLTSDIVEPILPFLKENTECSLKLYDGEIISVALPDHLVLEVTQADPWVKGDTASGGTKPVVLETGATIQAPVFVNVGEKIKIDTRTGKYVERA